MTVADPVGVLVEQELEADVAARHRQRAVRQPARLVVNGTGPSQSGLPFGSLIKMSGAGPNPFSWNV